MKATSILKLSAALVALSSYANADTIFSFAADTNLSPTTAAANFNDSANDTYGTTDTGDGSGWGSKVTTNFNGASTVYNTGEQRTAGTNTTTYFGPTFYAGINRDAYKGSGGVIHSNGNGFRIRVNNIAQSDIDTSAAAGGSGGTNGLNFKAVFMFDSAAGDYVFGETDTLVAKLAAPNVMGGVGGRAYSASYRAMVKADGEYYAGSLYNVDLAALSGGGASAVLDVTDNAASATWTLMDNMESGVNSLQSAGNHTKNLTVDGSTTVTGSTLTNITQVGFLLETTAAVNTGGFNFGVRQFSAEASVAAVPEPSTYALIAGCLAMASVMIRRRKK
jgi:hypothetical protein